MRQVQFGADGLADRHHNQMLDSVVASDWNHAPWENGSGGPTSIPSSAAAKA